MHANRPGKDGRARSQAPSLRNRSRERPKWTAAHLPGSSALPPAQLRPTTLRRGAITKRSAAFGVARLAGRSDSRNGEDPPVEHAEPCLSVVIPCYNEVSTVRKVVDSVLASPWTAEIVIVDDGSTDGTREVLDEMDGSPTYERV